mmetsp:Transcript_124044/g.396944  ORF Transcript_124044/g.396944 Transcript_124044/m.396944 type:complete len:218 (+) Transcript_124044:1618-2271(+)
MVGNHTAGWIRCMHLVLVHTAARMSAQRNTPMHHSPSLDVEAAPAKSKAPRDTGHERSVKGLPSSSASSLPLFIHTAMQELSMQVANTSSVYHCSESFSSASEADSLLSRPMTPSREWLIAKSRAVWSNASLIKRFAPCRNKSLTISASPLLAAKCSEVRPSWFASLTSTPKCSNRSAVAGRPCSAAHMRDVQPSGATALASAPLLMRAFANFMWPL